MMRKLIDRLFPKWAQERAWVVTVVRLGRGEEGYMQNSHGDSGPELHEAMLFSRYEQAEDSAKQASQNPLISGYKIKRIRRKDAVPPPVTHESELTFMKMVLESSLDYDDVFSMIERFGWGKSPYDETLMEGKASYFLALASEADLNKIETLIMKDKESGKQTTLVADGKLVFDPLERNTGGRVKAV